MREFSKQYLEEAFRRPMSDPHNFATLLFLYAIFEIAYRNTVDNTRVLRPWVTFSTYAYPVSVIIVAFFI